jgi:hypothetical protein
VISEAAFRRAHPRYEESTVLDELRHTEFARLDAAGQVYLDYTGAGLYADSQLREHLELLRQNVFGNPHSLNPTSAAMTRRFEFRHGHVAGAQLLPSGEAWAHVERVPAGRPVAVICGDQNAAPRSRRCCCARDATHGS